MNQKYRRPYIAALFAVGLAAASLAATGPLSAEGWDSWPDDSIVELDPFVVEIEVLDEYNPDVTSTGTVIAVERDRIPFITSVVTQSLINDLRIDNPADLAEQIAGVSQDENPMIADEGGNPPVLNFRVRGFLSEPLYNGFQTGGRIHGVDNIGRIEVSKGPNAVLYGQAPAGGLVNIVTKAPLADPHASFMVGAGSNAWRRAAFDAGTPLVIGGGDEDNAGIRINAGHVQFEREQPFFESELSTYAAAFAWEINDRVKLDLQGEYNQLDSVPSRTAAFVSTGSGPDRVTDPFNRLRERRNFTYSGPYAFIERESFLSTMYVTFKLLEDLRLRVGGIYSEQDEEHRSLIGSYGLATTETINNVRYGHEWGYRETTGYKLDLLHVLERDWFSLSSMLGFEAQDRMREVYELQTLGNLTVSIPFGRAPEAGDFPAVPALSDFTVVNDDLKEDLEWSNLRGTQIFSALDEDLTIAWGVAHGQGKVKFEQLGSTTESDGDEMTYTAGAKYRFVDKGEDAMLNSATVFANYATSFQIQAGNQQNPSDFLGFTTVADLQNYINNRPPNSMDPQTGSGYELGLRFEFLEKTMSFELAYYKQERSNIARRFFVRENLVAGVVGQDVLASYELASEEKASGIELALEWRPNDIFRVHAAANFIDGEIVSNIEDPGEVGLGLVSTPEESVNVFALYSTPFGLSNLNDELELGIGLSYNSETRTQEGSDNQYRLSDDYMQTRFLLRYRISDYEFAMNIENVFDDEWVNEGNWLSEGRSFKFTLSKQF
jgi:iron complex outermembrane receptor protein